MKEILFMLYLITSFTSITMLSLFSTTFLTMKKRNRVLSQSMRPGAVYRNGAQCCMRDFYFLHVVSPFHKIWQEYAMKDILIKYLCEISSKPVESFSRKSTFLIFLPPSTTPTKMNFQGYNWEKFCFTWSMTEISS